MDLVETTTGTVIIVAPLTVALVAAIAQVFKNMDDRYKPVDALVVGVALAFLVATDLSTRTTILAGIISGLTASGLYSGGKAVAGK